VGPEGQTRIGRAVVDVPFGGLAGEVAVRYLAGAGVGVVRVGDARLASVARAVDPEAIVQIAGVSAPSPPLREAWRHDAARELARGAVWALEALRAAIEGEP
jgi:hypothetical protein